MIWFVSLDYRIAACPRWSNLPSSSHLVPLADSATTMGSTLSMLDCPVLYSAKRGCCSLLSVLS